jgi:hypothetical protein
MPRKGKGMKEIAKDVFKLVKDVGGASVINAAKKKLGLGKKRRVSNGRTPERPRKGRGFWADLAGGVAGLLAAETGPAGAMAAGLGVKTLMNQLGLGRRGRRGTGVTTHPTVSSSGFAKI